MEAEIFFGLVLRLLPAIVVCALGFVAISDKKTRDQWNKLLYQIGSISPDQLENAKTGRGVKWPFFIVAIALLIWPVQFYRHATRSIDASASDLKIAKPQSDLSQSTPTPNAISDAPARPQSDLSRSAPAQNATSDAPARPQSDLGLSPAPTPNSPAPQSDLSQTAR